MLSKSRIGLGKGQLTGMEGVYFGTSLQRPSRYKSVTESPNHKGNQHYGSI